MNTAMHNRGGTGHRPSGRGVDPRTWATTVRTVAGGVRALRLADLVVLAVAVTAGVLSSLRHASSAVTVCVVGALVALAVAASIDRRTLRLPNVLTVTGLALGIVAGVIAGTTGGALVGALLVAAPFLVVHLVDPAGMGFGDVKCAAAAGAVAGAVVPTIGPLVAVVAILLGVVGLRLGRRSDGPHALGPVIVLGASVALLAAAALAADSETSTVRQAESQETR